MTAYVNHLRARPVASCRGTEGRGFTLIELLLSVTILSVVLMTTTSMLNASLGQLRIAEARNGQFREVQAAFETMCRRLEACEINPYYDYVYANNDTNTVPTGYKLQSDLHFVSGPANAGTAPVIGSGNRTGHAVFFHGTYGLSEQKEWKGLDTLLNSWGYFLEFGSDDTLRPTFLNSSSAPVASRHRFRLKELQVPAEMMRTYALKLNTQTTRAKVQEWYTTALADSSNVHTVAENIVACVIFPMVPDGSTTSTGGTLKPEALAPAYGYDTRSYQYTSSTSGLAEVTRHRLPPLLRLTLVAVDDVSATRLQDTNGSAMPSLGLDGLFLDASKYDADIRALEDTLVGQKLNYRVFSTTVRLRNARWNGTY
ncbi:Verru_Chthon cassette protein C [Verrucomicrobium spinosum]|uniref:Verru_Chthon cassette protein C n=1 Tax=Verrucomicrobium spinosum TaxID=2736 RepID=UPI0001745E63|nr:Verru_Chthon cassette protein C [Verrucomicrobium spinosum]